MLLERIIPDHWAMDDCEVERDFPRLGKHVLLLSASIDLYEKGHKNILLRIEDITLNAPWNAKRMSCSDRRTSFSMKSNTASATASRLSPA